MTQHILSLQDFIDTMQVRYSKDEDETHVSVACLKVDNRKTTNPDYVARQIELESQIPQQIAIYLQMANINFYKIWDIGVVCTGKATANQIKEALMTR